MVKYYKFNRSPPRNGIGWVKVKTRKNSEFCWFCDIYFPNTSLDGNKLNSDTKCPLATIEYQLKELKAEEIPKEEFIKAAIQYGR